MPEKQLLRKIISQGITYTTPEKIAYVVEREGTDSTTGANLTIDNKPTGDIVTEIASLYQKPDQHYGPIDLGDLPYVIPPDTKFTVSGGTGDMLSLIGYALEMETPQNLPGALSDRYDEQFRHYWRAVEGETEVVSGGAAWSEGNQQEVYSLTPLTTEEYAFAQVFQGYLVNNENTESPGDVGLIFKYDNRPMPFDWAENIDRGIDLVSVAADTDAGYEARGIPLDITVEGDDTLSIEARKNSTNTLNTATTMSIGVRAVVEYIKR